MPTVLSTSTLSQVATDVASAIGIPVSALTPAATIAFILWFCYRTQSTHFLLLWSWRLMHGKRSLGDVQLDRFTDDRTKLMFMRLYTGLPLRTLEHARRLLKWLAWSGEDPASVKRCGNYFDMEAYPPALRKVPSKASGRALVTLAAIVAVLGSFALVCTVTPKAIMQMKASRIRFLLSADAAITFSGSPLISLADCDDKKLTTSAQTLTEDERSSLCEFFRDVHRTAAVEGYVKNQRIVFGTLFVEFAIAGACLCLSFHRMAQAQEMQRRLRLRRNYRRRRAKARRLPGSPQPMRT